MRISILGDIMVTMEQLNLYKTDDGYDFSSAVASIDRVFKNSDLVIANLETPVWVGGGVF